MKVILAVCWLAAGHALGLALFWALVNVPESNVWMLALSTLLVALIGQLAITLYASTVLWLQNASGLVRAVRSASTRWLPALAGALLGGLIWWAGRAMADALTARAGEIDAWVIAQFNRSDAAGLHQALGFLTGFVQYVAAPAVGTTAFCVALFDGVINLRVWTWLARAVSVRALSQTAVAVLLLIWGPWQLAYWRPTLIPANMAEIVFAAVKLASIFAVANLGVVLLLLAGMRAAQSRIDERDHL